MSRKFDDLKKVLRSIIISENINGMTLQSLEQCYRTSEGANIPLMGYNSTEALLKTMTDTVHTVRTVFFIVSIEYMQKCH